MQKKWDLLISLSQESSVNLHGEDWRRQLSLISHQFPIGIWHMINLLGKNLKMFKLKIEILKKWLVLMLLAIMVS